MKDKDILEVVQARIEGKHLEKQNKNAQWQDVAQDEALNFEEYFYRVKRDNCLPKTWEEYCNDTRCVSTYLSAQMPWIGYVAEEAHSYTNAFVALAKLIMLRDCYNGYRTPSHIGTRHCIGVRKKDNREITFVSVASKAFSSSHKYIPRILCFHTPELRDAFMENFKGLILEAAELLV